jgi:V/A-type H+-transporting ATPase subunit F
MKVMVIGHPEAVLGFSLAGVSGRAALSSAEAHAAMDEALQSRELGIVLVTKDAARLMGARMDELNRRSTLPLIVEIPAPGGEDAHEPALSEIVLRAIGIRL